MKKPNQTKPSDLGKETNIIENQRTKLARNEQIIIAKTDGAQLNNKFRLSEG